MNNNLPYIRLFPGDYLRSSVSICSIGAQGLWFRILILLHDSERRGYLTMNNAPMPSAYAARQCSVTPDEYDVLLAELLSVKALSTSGNGTIFLPQMVAEFRRKDRNAASQRKRRANLKAAEEPPDKPKKRHRSVTPPVIGASSLGHGDNSEVIVQSSVSEKEKDKSNDLSSKKKSKSKKSETKISAKRIPDDFATTDAMLDWARENAPDVSVSVTTQKFINHYKSKTGAGALSCDWTATWKNYVLTAQEMHEKSVSPPGQTVPSPPGDSPEKIPKKALTDASDLSPPTASIPEPLNAESRENALVVLRGIVRDYSFDSIHALASGYTLEDWLWLTNRLREEAEKTGEP